MAAVAGRTYPAVKFEIEPGAVAAFADAIAALKKPGSPRIADLLVDMALVSQKR